MQWFYEQLDHVLEMNINMPAIVNRVNIEINAAADIFLCFLSNLFNKNVLVCIVKKAGRYWELNAAQVCRKCSLVRSCITSLIDGGSGNCFFPPTGSTDKKKNTA